MVVSLRAHSKGIEISVNDVLPQEDIEIVLDKCLRIGLEVKRTKAYQFSFWQIVKSSTEIKGQKNKDALSKIDGTVATEMFSKKEKMWTKAFQKLHAKSDIVDNDLCEAFNSSIVESRWWQLYGILCPHASCAIWHGGGDPYEFLHLCYDKDTYSKAYNYVLQPINGPHDWNKYELEFFLPPVYRDMSRRPKKNQWKSKDEPKKDKPEHLNRTGLIMTCRNCDAQGHNKRSYSRPKTANQEAIVMAILQQDRQSGSNNPRKLKEAEESMGTQESVTPTNNE
ncbi:uncharacterized protein LOC120134297 [Hibiscus syriacus]|uniref:uncharacterized protein LOC120134297 n=1 Tax=Hibiscus syriacus TaxID=106335 RepID=UPI001921CC6E|nr:uncharacterized protein LOC120134297 [Hibiscus syriacus]